MKQVLQRIIFDYGGVISTPQDVDCVSQMAALTGLERKELVCRYRRHRDEYDAGILDAPSFWQAVAGDDAPLLEQDVLEKLRRLDVASWTRLDPAMVSFLSTLRRKVPWLALISNITPDALEHIRRHHSWWKLFDVLTFSCEVGHAKPSRQIYLSCLKRIPVPPAELLFVDDVWVNLRGAEEAGLRTLHYRSFYQFKKELGCWVC